MTDETKSPMPDTNRTLGTCKIAFNDIYIPETFDIRLSFSHDIPFGSGLPPRKVGRITFTTTTMTDEILRLFQNPPAPGSLIVHETNPIGRKKRIFIPAGVLSGTDFQIQDRGGNDVQRDWQELVFQYEFDKKDYVPVIRFQPKDYDLTDDDLAEILGIDMADAIERDELHRTDLHQVCRGLWQRNLESRTWHFILDPDDESWMEYTLGTDDS